ncbi:type IVB secretion system protein IcmH/DotU [Vibrio parahaemolyticus]
MTEPSQHPHHAVHDIFEFRRDGLNLFSDVSSGLMGLALRLKGLASCSNVEAIYEQVRDEIRNIDVELNEANVEPALSLAYRYVLCAFLDEAVLATPWGPDSVWGAQSMLAHFHNETWGGEKVFSILERLQTDPHRYASLLVFIYQCLMLGFEGKYGVMKDGMAMREKVIQQLKMVIDSTGGASQSTAILRHEQVATQHSVITRQWSVWSVIAGFAVLWGVIFALYHSSLVQQSADVLVELNQILS